MPWRDHKPRPRRFSGAPRVCIDLMACACIPRSFLSRRGREAVRQQGLIDDADGLPVRFKPDAARVPCR